MKKRSFQQKPTKKVIPKKRFGQHFLKDEVIAQDIANALAPLPSYLPILEIGPGTGALTKWLIPLYAERLHLVELDFTLSKKLSEDHKVLKNKIIQADILKIDLKKTFNQKIAIIGNLPYNISSPIFFQILTYRDIVEKMVCMIQKEVAQRIAAPPGNKTYGLLSVFLQAFYQIEYLFEVPPAAFIPPPKVESAVIRLTRNTRSSLDCNESLFFQIIKTSFQQRRKTLRNSLKSYQLPISLTTHPVFNKRPETLSVNEFIELTKNIESYRL